MQEHNHSGEGHSKEIIIKINLEELFHKGEGHPEHHDPGTIIYYVIKVDKSQFEVKEHELTGRQILKLVGLEPEKYRLFEIGEGQREIAPDQTVDFRKCGIERFKSVAKHANEGKEATIGVASPSLTTQRKMVQLLADDERFLNQSHKGNWESIFSGNAAWILIHNFKVPEGYNVQETKVAFMIPSSYPTVEFDMMYFSPALVRTDGKGIGALSIQPIDGESFQRWSRHRNAGEWRVDVDNVETHALSVQSWLIDELKK